ncbi:hypothetical protein Nepgr_015833 [Nepenthes gracilis]|uniref:Uncharacterized protein n=1 Tax=Nepenthes gracilis TaxID=150966 RepID=A0AAD3XQQ2_NEPGR|nr:hypothetical protein Nepgr_015833 [Nepenthes gracilis]
MFNVAGQRKMEEMRGHPAGKHTKSPSQSSNSEIRATLLKPASSVLLNKDQNTWKAGNHSQSIQEEFEMHDKFKQITKCAQYTGIKAKLQEFTWGAQANDLQPQLIQRFESRQTEKNLQRNFKASFTHRREKANKTPAPSKAKGRALGHKAREETRDRKKKSKRSKTHHTRSWHPNPQTNLGIFVGNPREDHRGPRRAWLNRRKSRASPKTKPERTTGESRARSEGRRMGFGRICVELKKGDPQPAKIKILSGTASSAKLIEVLVAYHSVPSRLKSRTTSLVPAVDEGGYKSPIPDQVLVDSASPDAGTSVISPLVNGVIVLVDGDLDHQTGSPANVECYARGKVSSLAACSVSAGDVPVDDGALSGSMKDEPAYVVTNSDHSLLDVGAPCVDDHVAGSPHRPLLNAGVDGVAIADECGLIPVVDGSTPESIARIARKYSLVDVVDGLLNKVPLVYQAVSSTPMSGCPIKSSEATSPEEVQPCDPGYGPVHALPSVDLCAGDPVARAIPPSSEANGSLQATSLPVEPSPGYMADVQGLSPCNQSAEEYAEVANRPLSSPVPGTGCSVWHFPENADNNDNVAPLLCPIVTVCLPAMEVHLGHVSVPILGHEAPLYCLYWSMLPSRAGRVAEWTYCSVKLAHFFAVWTPLLHYFGGYFGEMVATLVPPSADSVVCWLVWSNAGLVCNGVFQFCLVEVKTHCPIWFHEWWVRNELPISNCFPYAVLICCSFRLHPERDWTLFSRFGSQLPISKS